MRTVGQMRKDKRGKIMVTNETGSTEQQEKLRITLLVCSKEDLVTEEGKHNVIYQ